MTDQDDTKDKSHPTSFNDWLDEEIRLAEENAARREARVETTIQQAAPELHTFSSVADIIGEITSGNFLDGFTVEQGEHPLPPEVAAKLKGRKLH